MRIGSRHFFVIGCILLQWATGSLADTCTLSSQRAPVSAVCGRVINIAGERLSGVELSLTRETDSVTFTVRSDADGQFSFRSVPKGDYLLRVAAPDYHSAMRQIRVTRSSNNRRCTGKITVKLGFKVCDTFIRVRGTDR